MKSMQEFYNLCLSHSFNQKEILDYLEFRNFNRIKCSKKELKYLDIITEHIKSNLDDNILLKNELEILYVLSKREIDFEQFLELKNKDINNYTEDDIYNYLTIITKTASSLITKNNLNFFINKIFVNQKNIKPIIDILEENTNVIEKRKKKQLINTIYDIYYIIITKLIENEIINGGNNDNLKPYLDYLPNVENDIFAINILRYLKNKIDRINYQDDIRNKLNNPEEFIEFLNYYYKSIIERKKSESIYKEKIILGDIIITNQFPHFSNINYLDKLPINTEDKIITIDDETTTDLDGAFSIQKHGDMYRFKVYISDVPTFLSYNRNICKLAYQRGNSLYIGSSDEKNYLNLDMIPTTLSHGYLSLQTGRPKNVIVFNFLVHESGVIYERRVERYKVLITKRLSPKEAKYYLYNYKGTNLTKNILKTYKEFCNIILNNTKEPYLKRLNTKNINNLVAIPSILMNYYIGEEADFAIYRENGMFRKDAINKYTQSVTPIRRFVSNINLAFLLEQKGLVKFPDKDLYYVENNIDSILDHLNERERFTKFAESNPDFIKKYLRKK